MSTKGEILRTLAESEAPDSLELTHRLSQRGLATNRKTVVTLVWDLQKQALVTFRERNDGGRGKDVTRIALTDKGRDIAFRADKEDNVPKTPLGPTVADRIEKLMLEHGPEKRWRAPEIVEALGLTATYAGEAVTTAMIRNAARFARPEKGAYTLAIWANQPAPPAVVAPAETAEESAALSAQIERLLANAPMVSDEIASELKIDVDRARLVLSRDRGTKFEKRNGLWHLISAPDEQQISPDEQQGAADSNGQVMIEMLPAATSPAPDAIDPFAGLAYLTALLERAKKRASLVAAARILEETGEDELAISVLARVELTPLEDEVVTFVERVTGTYAAAGSTPGEVRERA